MVKTAKTKAELAASLNYVFSNFHAAAKVVAGVKLASLFVRFCRIDPLREAAFFADCCFKGH